MRSRCIAVTPTAPEMEPLQEAVSVLEQGGVVAYPTDTVYGLAVDATNVVAIARLYDVKQRALDKAIPLIIGEVGQLTQVAAMVPAQAKRLMAAFWPGPLTLLLKPHPDLPAELRGKSARIGVRWPTAAISQTLALTLGRAITATSANRSGAPVALSAADVVAQLDSVVDLILDGGAASSSEVSTVLDVVAEPPLIIRSGKVSPEAIGATLGCEVGSISGRGQEPLSGKVEKG